MHFPCSSTAVTNLAPRDANSKEIFPVPQNKSNTSMPSKSIRLLSILNNPSLAKSVVGRIGNPFGAFSTLPLCVPPIMRNG